MGTIANKLLLCIATAGLCALAPMSAALAAAERATFPSSLRREGLGSHEQIELPALGTEGGRRRVPSRVEEFARRVHREGLPVARLWENKSALVSLGLNTKGKPGLWVIQKMR